MSEAAQVATHDLDAEASVLSAVMLDPLALDRVEGLQPSDFYSGRHHRIFEACVAVRKTGKPVDVTTVGGWLKDRRRLQEVGGMPYLGEILDATPAPANVAAHAELIRNHADRRALASSLERMVTRCRHGQGDSRAILESVRRDATEALEATAPQPADPWLWKTDDVFAQLPDVPWLCEGLRLAPGAPTLIAGYGFSGKTISAQSLALAVAVGGRAWDSFPCRAGLVRHIDHEQGQHTTFSRYQRLARAMGIRPDELRGRLQVSVMPNVYLDGSDAEGHYMRAADGAALVVLDSLRAAIPSADENSSEVRRHLDLLGLVSERTGCVFLVIHHAGKPNVERAGRFSMRGSSSLFDAAGSVFVFSAPERGAPTEVEHAKERVTGQPLDSFGLEVRDVPIDLDERAGVEVVTIDPSEMADRRAKADEAKQAEDTSRAGDAIATFFERQGPIFQGSKEALRSALKMGRPAFTKGLAALETTQSLELTGSYHQPIWRFHGRKSQA